MADSKGDLEQTHCIISKVFAFTVPPLGSAEGFKASLWPKQPIWVGRLRVVSRNDKCAILLEHTDKDGLFASCPIQNAHTVEPTLDSSRYFVLRLSDGKGRHALLGIGFNDRAQAFDFKVALQDLENRNASGGEDLAEATRKHGGGKDWTIPQGGSITVNFGAAGAGSGSGAGGAAPKKKKKNSAGPQDLSAAVAGLKLEDHAKDKKKKKKHKHQDKDAEPGASSSSSSAAGFDTFDSFNTTAPAASSTSSSTAPVTASSSTNLFDFFDPLSSSAPAQQPAQQPLQQQHTFDPFASTSTAADPFGGGGGTGAGAVDPFGSSEGSKAAEPTPFDTPFDETPSDWVKF